MGKRVCVLIGTEGKEFGISMSRYGGKSKVGGKTISVASFFLSQDLF